MVYRLYGLGITSNKAIPGLSITSAQLPINVRVWFGINPPWVRQILASEECWYNNELRDEQDQPILTIWKLNKGEYYRFLYNDGTEFVIDRLGSQVWATWIEPMTPEDTATYLLGPVMGFVLLLRGKIALHASAVAIYDQAIALVGPAGAGKSTTAAAFSSLGYPILSEDVVVLSERSGQFFVESGYPLIRLWPNSVRALYGAVDALPCLTPNWDKRYLDLTANAGQFQVQALPLTAIYLLKERSNDANAPFVQSIPNHQSLINLITNTYASRYMDKIMRGNEFDFLSRIVTSTPIRQIVPHRDPIYLKKLCEVIAKDFQDLNLSL